MTTADAERIAGVVALAATGVCTATLVVLHLLPTGLSPLRNPVSQYGITNYRLGYRIQTVSMGIAAIAAAVGVGELDVSGCTTVVTLLALFAAARLAISWFPMDEPGSSERTATGRRHGVLAIVAFAGAGIAAIQLGNILDRAGVWPGTSTAVLALGVAMLVSLVLMGATRQNPAMRAYFGLVERGFYAGAIAFLVVVGSRLAAGH